MAGRLQCDIILRGGITSGIVYPRAIAKLAETYDFRSIGGSSAGAIAASWTAAAAFAAKRGHDIFQTRIKTHPQELAETRDGKTTFNDSSSHNRAHDGSSMSLRRRLGVTLRPRN